MFHGHLSEPNTILFCGQVQTAMKHTICSFKPSNTSSCMKLDFSKINKPTARDYFFFSSRIKKNMTWNKQKYIMYAK